jgi:hypothetical protein
VVARRKVDDLGRTQFVGGDHLVCERGVIDAVGVFVEQDKRARFVALPGAQEGRAAPLALPLDTRLVVRGQAMLQDGAPIN